MNETRHELQRLWNAVPGRLMLAGLLLVVALVFLPTLGFGFVYDDHWILLGNGFLRTPQDAESLFRPEAVARHVPDAFRPTSVLFEMAVYQLVGTQPHAQHAISVLLHLAVCALVWAWLARLGAPRSLQAATVASFGVLARHAEPVAVVSYREDLLAAALGLGALVVAERATTADRGRALGWAAVGAILMALACGAKLSAAPLCAVFLLVHRVAPWRAPSGRRAWLVAVALGLGVLADLLHRVLLHGGVSPYDDPADVLALSEGLAPVLAASAQIHLGYLQQMLVPLQLSPEYVDFTARWTDAATLLASAALASLAVVGIVQAWTRVRPVVALAILGAFLLALPTSNVVGLPNMRADRFVYLTSLPVCIGVSAALLTGGEWLARRYRRPHLGLAPLVAFVVLQGAFAQGAAAVYRSDSRLWTIALRHAPHSARAHAIAGELLVARMREHPDAPSHPQLLARARTHCIMAMRLDPDDDLPYLCQARLSAMERDWLSADDHFALALERAGDRADRALLGLASTSLDRPDLSWEERQSRALALADRAIREYPYNPEAWAVSARLHHRLGDPGTAGIHYARARALAPERWDLVLAGVELALDLGHASAARRRWPASKKLLDEADPTLVSALRHRLRDARLLFPSSSTDQTPPRPKDSPRHDP